MACSCWVGVSSEPQGAVEAHTHRPRTHTALSKIAHGCDVIIHPHSRGHADPWTFTGLNTGLPLTHRQVWAPFPGQAAKACCNNWPFLDISRFPFFLSRGEVRIQNSVLDVGPGEPLAGGGWKGTGSFPCCRCSEQTSAVHRFEREGGRAWKEH